MPDCYFGFEDMRGAGETEADDYAIADEKIAIPYMMLMELFNLKWEMRSGKN